MCALSPAEMCPPSLVVCVLCVYAVHSDDVSQCVILLQQSEGTGIGNLVIDLVSDPDKEREKGRGKERDAARLMSRSSDTQPGVECVGM